MYICPRDDAELEQVGAQLLFMDQAIGQGLANVTVFDLAGGRGTDEVRKYLEVGEFIIR